MTFQTYPYRYPWYKNDTQRASILTPVFELPENPCLCLTSATSAYWDSIGDIILTNSANWNSAYSSAYLWNETYNIVSSNSR